LEDVALFAVTLGILFSLPGGFRLRSR
jgi:hypothetical protein